MEALVVINRQRIFTLEEAQRILPIIVRISDTAQREMDYLNRCIKALPQGAETREQEFRRQLENVVQVWEMKVEKLGAIPKGLWMADFDNGEGYWCWKFPERSIMFVHGYDDGYSGRRPVC